MARSLKQVTAREMRVANKSSTHRSREDVDSLKLFTQLSSPGSLLGFGKPACLLNLNPSRIFIRAVAVDHVAPEPLLEGLGCSSIEPDYDDCGTVYTGLRTSVGAPLPALQRTHGTNVTVPGAWFACWWPQPHAALLSLVTPLAAIEPGKVWVPGR
jgi:hypothetical protein